MTVRSVQAGAAVNLAKCENLATQSFELNASGQIVIQAQPSLCVTVSSTEKKEGRGGSPVHVMRPLSLQACQDSKQPYQTWLLHSL
ncbi:hypothetical protein Q4488_01105 [Amphritea sp. 1_MG-2023]|uniref:hypothetical protein n=1 Tax=Amphritea sp. 1_MG-2023 TaxID=3062670 RepID=UPI0026E37EC3|nr:hypothetical protein [Amphritea sp. 1_MG-2023]MDO6561970.1 hypothetical protein [Amphritea sp. 1_MG-2023]